MYDLKCVVANVRAAKQPVHLEYLDRDSIFFHDQYVRYEMNLLLGTTVPIGKERVFSLDFRACCCDLEKDAFKGKLKSTQAEQAAALKPMSSAMVYGYHTNEVPHVPDLKTVRSHFLLAFIVSVASQQVKADDLLKALKLFWAACPITKATKIFTGGYVFWKDDEQLSVEDILDSYHRELKEAGTSR